MDQNIPVAAIQNMRDRLYELRRRRQLIQLGATTPASTDYLRDFAVAYQMSGLIGLQLLPRIDEPNPAGRFYKFGREAFRLYKTLKPSTGMPNKVEFLDSYGSFSCKDQGLWTAIPFRDLREFGFVGVETARAQALMDMMDLSLEVEIAALLTTYTNYNADMYATVSTKWANNQGDPIADFEAMFEALRKKINKARGEITVAVGAEPAKWLAIHDAIKEAGGFKYKPGEGVNVSLTAEQIRQALRCKAVLIGDASYITSKEGQTETTGDVWGDFVVGAYVPTGAPEKFAPAAGYTFSSVWNEPEIEDNTTGKTGTRDVYIYRDWDPKFCAVDSSSLAIAAYLMIDPASA